MKLRVAARCQDNDMKQVHLWLVIAAVVVMLWLLFMLPVHGESPVPTVNDSETKIKH